MSWWEWIKIALGVLAIMVSVLFLGALVFSRRHGKSLEDEARELLAAAPYDTCRRRLVEQRDRAEQSKDYWLGEMRGDRRVLDRIDEDVRHIEAVLEALDAIYRQDQSAR